MKRTITSAMCIAVAFVFTTSCNKIEDNPIASERTVITAVAEAVGGGEAKAHSQYSYDVFWDKGDKIYVTGGEKSNTFTVSPHQQAEMNTRAISSIGARLIATLPISRRMTPGAHCLKMSGITCSGTANTVGLRLTA